MAETDLDAEVGFAGVSRLRGKVFALLARAASWFGIVVLGLLLALVVVDAFGLAAASSGWYAGALAGFGTPTVIYAWYVTRTRPALRSVAARSAVLPLAGLVMAGGLAVLFVIFEPLLWFVYYTVSVLPAVLVFLLLRRQEDSRAPLVGGFVGAVGFAAASVLAGWIPIKPVTWLILLWVLVVPFASLVASRSGTDSRNRQSTIAGIIVVGGILAGAVVPRSVAVSPEVSIILYLSVLVPLGWYAGLVVSREQRRWPGLLSPLVLGAAGWLGLVLADTIGRQGPDVWLDWQFLTSAASTFPEQAGLFPAIVGSVFIIDIVAVVSFVVGVGAAIYLEEYAPTTGYTGLLTRVIRVNVANLAGVPSVVYGLLGLGLFVNLLGMGLGIVLVAGLTLSLLILPIVIISAQEAIRSVPNDVRQASYGMGATKWQTIRNVVLPRAIPGILTGTILALSRAIGETAPLLMIGAATTVFSAPETFSSQVSAMPLQVFYWSFSVKSTFREFVAPAGVVTLLGVMLSMNAIAIYLRNRYEQRT
jgi:phosphate transport system permease protein